MSELIFQEEGHKYIYEGREVPSVTQIIQAAGLVDFSHVHKAVLEQASDFGTKVHEATALFDKGELDVFTLDPGIAPYLEAWKKFRGDTGICISIIEEPAFNKQFGFAGTPDRVGMIHSARTVIDIKTGALLPAAAVQTAAYALLCAPIKRRMSVQLLGDGTYKAVEHQDSTDLNVFRSCLSIYNYKKRRGI
jgi:hypothetical protein